MLKSIFELLFLYNNQKSGHDDTKINKKIETKKIILTNRCFIEIDDFLRISKLQCVSRNYINVVR